MGHVEKAKIVTGRLDGAFRVPSEVGIRIQCPPVVPQGPLTCEIVFGQQVQVYLKEKKMKPEHVFRYFKYAMHQEYEVDSTGADGAEVDELLKEVKEQHSAILAIIKDEYQGNVIINKRDTQKSREIASIDDIIVAFFEFMLESTKQEMASKGGIQLGPARRVERVEIKGLDDIFNNRLQMAASVPAAWSTSAQDRYLKLLFAAGFPRSTILLNETTSAIKWYFNNQANPPQIQTSLKI